MFKQQQGTLSFSLFVLLFTSIFQISGCATTNAKNTLQESEPSTEQLVQQADMALRKNDLDNALLLYVQALEDDSDNVDVLFKIAVIHDSKGNYTLAEKAYRDVITRKPLHAGSQQGIGLILLRKGQHADAESHLKNAINRAPEQWRSHNALGIIYDVQQTYSLAQSHYKKALITRPESTMLLNNLGYSKYLEGDLQGALSHYRQVLNIDSKNRKAWSNLGLLYVRQGKYDSAVNAFNQLNEKHKTYNSIGYLCLLDHRYLSAEEFFIKAIKFSPSYYDEAHRNLAETRIRIADVKSSNEPEARWTIFSE